jgi:hypothetical protein
MRVAICFSGQPRFVRECFDKIKKNIIEFNSSHQIDIFVHTWFSKELCNKILYVNEMSSFSGDATIDENSLDSIIELYNPISITHEKEKDFKSNIDFDKSLEKYLTGYKTSGISRQEYRDIKLSCTYSMWYSALQSGMLKKNYELSEGFTYDLVLKMRFDSIVNYPIDFNVINPNVMYYQELGQPDNMVSDWINISNSSNMDSYFSIYLSLEKLSQKAINEYGGWTSESLIRQVCNRDNIPTQGYYFNTELPRWGKL